MKQIILNKAKVSVVRETSDEVVSRKIIARADRDIEVKSDAFYVGDMGDVVKKHLTWTTQLPRVEPFYAVKCNDDATVLAVLAQLGTGFDCASKAELQKVLELQVPTSRIIYANPCKQSSHIKYAASNNVEYMTFDNETELHKVKAIHPHAKMVVRILPPANTKCQCQLGMKFGCHPKKVPQLLRVARQLGVDVVGVSFHVGSGCYDAMAYSAAVASARTVFGLAEAEGFKFTLLDIGGGFPGQQGAKLPFEEICAVLRPALDVYFPPSLGVRIIAEPGRYYVASAFTLALNVIARRVVTRDELDSDDADNANVDNSTNADEGCSTDDNGNGSQETGSISLADSVDGEGSNNDPTYMYYLNDGVYGSFNCILFDHATVQAELFDEERFANAPRYGSSLWGPTCDGLDCIVQSCPMPELQTGDWLLFHNMGAYTLSAASTFNGMPKPRLHYVMHETEWLTLCRLSGMVPELQLQLPMMKTGLDVPSTEVDDLSLQPIHIEV
jgi:ornithine decarboxylase